MSIPTSSKIDFILMVCSINIGLIWVIDISWFCNCGLSWFCNCGYFSLYRILVDETFFFTNSNNCCDLLGV